MRTSRTQPESIRGININKLTFVTLAALLLAPLAGLHAADNADEGIRNTVALLNPM